MKDVSHLPISEQQHFCKCAVCDHYFDMRDLGDVMTHEHDKEVPMIKKMYNSKRVGDNVEYIGGKDPVNLN